MVDDKSNENIRKKTKPALPTQIPVTKDEEVAARRAAYQYFYNQEKRKAGYRYDSDKMSKEDKKAGGSIFCIIFDLRPLLFN